MKSSKALIEAINNLQEIIYKENIDPRNGLLEELLVFATTLMPVSDVDLLITDCNGRILLSRRDDKYYGKGLHIPGGYIRLQELWHVRIQKTALRELKTEAIYDRKPLAVFESMTNDIESRWIIN